MAKHGNAATPFVVPPHAILSAVSTEGDIASPSCASHTKLFRLLCPGMLSQGPAAQKQSTRQQSGGNMIRKVPSIFYSGMNSSSGDNDNNFVNNKRSNKSNREKLKTSRLPRKMTTRNALLVTTVLLATTTIAMNTQQATSSDGPTTEVSEARRATATADFVARGMEGSWGGGSWGSSPKPDKRSLHKALSSLRGSSGPLSGAGDTAADMNPMHKILNQMIQANIRGTSPTAKAMARLELAVKKYFIYGGLNPWKANTAGVECA
ncbi:unnamed protein product, partial [Ectocarpus sp. 12 AP-2014]